MCMSQQQHQKGAIQRRRGVGGGTETALKKAPNWRNVVSVVFTSTCCVVSLCFTLIILDPFFTLLLPAFRPGLHAPWYPLVWFLVAFTRYEALLIGSCLRIESKKRASMLFPGSFLTQCWADGSGCVLQDVASKGSPLILPFPSWRLQPRKSVCFLLFLVSKSFTKSLYYLSLNPFAEKPWRRLMLWV